MLFVNSIPTNIGASSGTRLDRIYASLVAALIGDAMGSATEQLTPAEVQRRFGRLEHFVVPGEGTFAAGRKPGLLTDDGAQLIGMAQLLVEKSGHITPRDVADVILSWAEDPELLRRFAGPSTRKAITALREGKTPEEAGAPDPTANDFRSTNGAAMKVAAVGLAFPGDIDRAVEAAGTMCVPTHNSDIAFAGAGAIGAAVSAAVAGGKTLEEVAEAAIAGARLGLSLGKLRAVQVPGPSVAARIEVARDIALGSHLSASDRITRLNDVIGGGLPIAEAVPLAVGIFLATGGDPMATVFEAVNLGNDSDTVATMAGAVAGAYAGSANLDASVVATLLEANEIDLMKLARQLDDLHPGEAR